jgi:hypothetical protein
MSQVFRARIFNLNFLRAKIIYFIPNFGNFQYSKCWQHWQWATLLSQIDAYGQQ